MKRFIYFDRNTSMHTKFLLCAVSLLVVSLSVQGEQKKAASETFYGGVPSQVFFDLNKGQGAPVQVKLCNYRLLYGAAGNGVRMTAQLYAQKNEGTLQECPFFELLQNYKKFGAEYVASVFAEAKKSAESTKKLVVLYIPGIDELSAPAGQNDWPAIAALYKGDGSLSGLVEVARIQEEEKRKAVIRFLEHERLVADHRKLLDLLLIEAEKEEYEGKVFVIFSTHTIANVHAGFLSRLECASVEIPIDLGAAAGIFRTTFLEEEKLVELHCAMESAQTKVSDACASAIVAKINEWEALEKRREEFFHEYIVLCNKNDACWFEQKDFRRAHTELTRLDDECAAKCSAIIALVEQSLVNAQLSEEKAYYLAVRDFILLFKISSTRVVLLLRNQELYKKLAQQFYRYPTKRDAKRLAQRIVGTAYVENGGVVTKEIFLRFMN